MADTLPQEVAEAIGALYMDGRLNLPNLDIVQSHLHRLACRMLDCATGWYRRTP